MSLVELDLDSLITKILELDAAATSAQLTPLVHWLNSIRAQVTHLQSLNGDSSLSALRKELTTKAEMIKAEIQLEMDAFPNNAMAQNMFKDLSKQIDTVLVAINQQASSSEIEEISLNRSNQVLDNIRSQVSLISERFREAESMA